MNKNILCLLLVLSCLQQAIAQETPSSTALPPMQERKTTLFAEPFAFIGSGLQVGVEYAFLPQRSIYVSLGYYLAEKYAPYDSREMEGFKAEAQLRFHIPLNPEKQQDMLFFGPYANFRTITLTHNINYNDPVLPFPLEDRKGTAQAAQIGVLSGYKLILMRKFSFDSFLGGGLIIPTSSYDSEKFHLPLFNPYQKGFNIKLGIAIGYMF